MTFSIDGQDLNDSQRMQVLPTLEGEDMEPVKVIHSHQRLQCLLQASACEGMADLCTPSQHKLNDLLRRTAQLLRGVAT